MSSTREVSRRTMIRGAAAVPAVAVLPAASTALTRAAAAPDPISNPASAPTHWPQRQQRWPYAGAAEARRRKRANPFEAEEWCNLM
jgi:cytochrome c-type biogenesis protein CcmH/NrfG